MNQQPKTTQKATCSRVVCLKIPGLLLLLGQKNCMMPNAGAGQVCSTVDRFQKIVALLDFENRILKITASTIPMHQKLQIVK